MRLDPFQFQNYTVYNKQIDSNRRSKHMDKRDSIPDSFFKNLLKELVIAFLLSFLLFSMFQTISARVTG